MTGVEPLRLHVGSPLTESRARSADSCFSYKLYVLIAARRLLLNAARRSKFSDSSKKFQFLVASPERRIRAHVDGNELDPPIRKGANSLYVFPFESFSPEYDPRVVWK
jgi:hypothetical protein